MDNHSWFIGSWSVISEVIAMRKETIADMINALMKAFGIVLVFLCGYFADDIFPTALFFVLGVLLIVARVEVTKGEIEE